MKEKNPNKKRYMLCVKPLLQFYFLSFVTMKYYSTNKTRRKYNV
ncbi:hypothetical protein M2450_000267 [Dysgonomonas sp. PF1-23]|nr:hypothetical protein [Dysgonomonas sp. PF1-23]